MKKIILYTSIMAVFAVAACTNDKTTETKKEVITTPAPVAPVPEKNTSISVDPNGVKVNTKKVDVSVSGDKKK